VRIERTVPDEYETQFTGFIGRNRLHDRSSFGAARRSESHEGRATAG